MVRLADDSTPEARAVQMLLQHRLSNDGSEAREEWHHVVDGSHPRWHGISEPYQETIRAFLIHFHTEILRNALKHFYFGNGSIGNFFFSGARLFFNSLETAIFWFSRVSGISDRTHVLPVINSNQRITIGVELENSCLILGQNAISHPPRTLHDIADNIDRSRRSDCCSVIDDSCDAPSVEAMNAAVVATACHQPLLPESRLTSVVDKSVAGQMPLPARIRRLFYLNEDHQEIVPAVNPAVLRKIIEQETIIYSMGSLFTR